MAGFGGEMIFLIGLGYVLLGPQRMRTVLQHVARVKREFQQTQYDLRSQLSSSLDREPKDPGT